MAIMMKRQLNDEEKSIILKRFGRLCYATSHKIPDNDEIHFDHIKSYVSGGPTELDNIAPMCQHHNLAKGQLPLEDFRIKLRIEDFFKQGNRLTLSDLLKYLKENKDIETYGENVVLTEINHGRIKVENHLFSQEFELQKCPLTNWKYFYGILPINIIDSDDDDDKKLGLQPRFLIFDKVFDMFRHFQYFPVLQPSIGRFYNGKIVLFDGQHKAASLLWTGRKNFECKIYLDPETSILNEANRLAHEKYAQTRFYASIMVLKLGAQFGKDFEEYKNIENDSSKSEEGLIEYLLNKEIPVTKGDINKKFRSYLFNSVLENENNKCVPLISISPRSTNEQPLTLDMLTKSIFSNFIFTMPLSDNILSDKYKRDSESKNVVALMNILFEQSLCSWNKDATPNDSSQLKLRRIYASKSIMAWTELFKDAICAKLDILDSDEKAKVFYRDISKNDFEKIKTIFIRLINWQMWSSPKNSEIDTVISSNRRTIKEWYKQKGLTVGYLVGAPE